MTLSSRRSLLRATLALPLAAPAAVAAPAGDAALIRLCGAFDAWERRDQALSGAHLPGSPGAVAEYALNERHCAEKGALLDRICDLPCTTPAGINALGNTLALYVGEEELEDGYKGALTTGS